MSEPKPKAKRGWIIWPWVIALLLVAGWSGWWVYARGKILDGLESQAQSLRTAGYDITWKSVSLNGYPFRFFGRFEQAQIHDPSGWGVSTPLIEAEASAFSPDVIVLSAPDGLVVSRPAAPAVAVTGQVMRMSLGGVRGPAPWRVSMEGLELTFAASEPNDLAISGLSRFEAHLRPEPDDQARILFRVKDARPNGDSLLSRLSSARPLNLGFEGQICHAAAFKGRSIPDLLSNWSRAGGALAIDAGGLESSGSLAALRPSTIRADAGGLADGQLKLTLTRAADGMLALGEVGVLPRETAAVASGVAAAGSAVTTGSGFDLTLGFHDGRTWLGPIPLGAAPKLY